jgi:hypothetical protein
MKLKMKRENQIEKQETGDEKSFFSGYLLYPESEDMYQPSELEDQPQSLESQDEEYNEDNSCRYNDLEGIKL